MPGGWTYNGGSTFTPNPDSVDIATQAELDAEAATRAAADVDPSNVGYDVVILAGQSNMEGRGGAADLRYDPLDVRIWKFPASGTDINTIVSAVDPLGHPSGTGSLGPGLPWARWYVGQLPPNRRVLLVPTAWGGTGFVGTDTPGRTWKIDNTGADARYPAAVTQARAALAAAGHNSRYAAILWHQGEADASASYVGTYADNLDDLIDAFRSDLGVSDLPFVMGQLVPDNFASQPYKKVINDIHVDTPRRRVRTGFAYGITGHNSGDHYDAYALRILARRMAEALVRAKVNILGTAPPVVTGLVLTQSGADLSAAWDQSARVTDYEVQFKLSSADSWTDADRTSPNLDVTQAIPGLTLGETYDVQVRSVNEEGSSAWTTETVEMAEVPAQVTGVTLGTATGASQPLTWDAISDATSYLVEYKKHSDSTWLTGATATTTSASVGSLTFSTSYDYRVSAVNAAGTGTPSATVTGSTAALDPVIDAIGVSAARGYSSRKMRAAYAGSAMRVRRSSDNTEQDIGFDGGALDTTALTTFAGSGSAFIKTLYDQSGNGLDLTQTTTANQPRIVNSGVLDVENSIATMIFDGSNDIFTDSSPGMYAAGHASVLAVWKIISSGSSLRVLGESRSSTTSTEYYPESTQSSLAGKLNALGAINDAGSQFGSRNGTITVTDALHQTSTVDTGSMLSKWVDGAVSDTNSNPGYTRTGSVTLDRFNIGGRFTSGAAGLFSSFHLSEVVIFNAALTTAQRQAGETNQKAFFGTP